MADRPRSRGSGLFAESSGLKIKTKTGALLAYLIYFTALTAASAAVSYQMLSYGEETRVPDFVGRSLKDATALARENRLHINVESSEYHPKVPVGYVMRQNIAAGADVKAGQIIGVVLSKGPVSALVPDFVGRQIEDARFLAVERGLQLKRISYTHHSATPEGEVITQNPAPGSRGASVISLLVSKGPLRIPVEVPQLVGRSAAELRPILQAAGLTVAYEGQGPDVVAQDPAAGARAFRGDTIRVSLGYRIPKQGELPWGGRP